MLTLVVDGGADGAGRAGVAVEAEAARANASDAGEGSDTRTGCILRGRPRFRGGSFGVLASSAVVAGVSLDRSGDDRF